jgi:hypothetical protein
MNVSKIHLQNLFVDLYLICYCALFFLFDMQIICADVISKLGSRYLINILEKGNQESLERLDV